MRISRGNWANNASIKPGGKAIGVVGVAGVVVVAVEEGVFIGLGARVGCKACQ